MSRSGYDDSDSDDYSRVGLWRGAVASAIRGRRGQAFLQEMLDAMDALPEKKLAYSELEKDGEVCAIGSVGRARGIDMTKLDPEYSYQIAKVFDISDALVREIVFMNDDGNPWDVETPEKRFTRMRAWISDCLTADP